MICTNCLREVPTGARFCKECGHAVQIGEGAKASKLGTSWKWGLGIFGTVVVAWALTEWAPDTEPAQSPETELDQAPRPAPLATPTPAAERATLTSEPPEAVPEAEQKPDTGAWNLRTEVSEFDDTKATYLELPGGSTTLGRLPAVVNAELQRKLPAGLCVWHRTASRP